MNSPTSQMVSRCLALHRQGKLHEALNCYEQVLRSDPKNSDALYYVAVIAAQEGQFADAIGYAQRALSSGPPQARVHNLLGQLLGKTFLRLGQAQEALASFDRAIAQQPDFADAHGNRANLLADLGRLDEALASYDRAIELRPDSPEDWSNRGVILHDLNRTEEALASYDRAILLRPDFAAAHFNRANILKDLHRLEEALAAYQHTIALQPSLAAAHSNYATALHHFNRHNEALVSIDRASALQPNDPNIIANRGNILRSLGRYDLAEAEYAHALRIDPSLSAPHLGRALILIERGHFSEARNNAEMAKTLDPEAPDPSVTLAYLQLLLGDWQEGWKNYEYRNRTLIPAYISLPYRRWHGEPLSGEQLIVMTEQGFGDAIQFARLVSILTARGFDATILTDQKMAALLSTLIGAKIITTTKQIERDTRPIFWVPMMGLPGILGLQPNTIPANVPYLAAESDRIADWTQRLDPGRFKIGIAWQPGSPPHWFSNKRAIPLAAFAPLAEIPGVTLFSLQKGDGIEQIAKVPFRDRIETFGEDFDNGPSAFLDTAAAMMNLDLIVTCDTSIAHLAGALARPVFVALPFAPCWRWHVDREDSPWYPTMRLFRQTAQDNWAEVFDRIAAAVRVRIGHS